MATITKTRGRKALAEGPARMGWASSNGEQVFNLSVRRPDGSGYITVRLTASEAEKFALYINTLMGRS